jgi:hypothetical protein
MYEGVLKKMITQFGSPIQYFLSFKEGFVNLNQCLNKSLSIRWLGSLCLNCKNEKEIFRQGFCKSCFFESPSSGDWIMRPELSKAHLGEEDRNLEFEKKIQLQPHIIYLAVSSHLKVGVTRKEQLPTRWVDQGAHEALTIVETPNRYLAGIGEVALKQFFSDKTNWRKMLQNEADKIDWEINYDKAIKNLPIDLKPFIKEKASSIVSINFPVINYPGKVKSLKLINDTEFKSKLVGIKGQYLIFDDQTVFNIRSNEGKVIRLTIQ